MPVKVRLPESVREVKEPVEGVVVPIAGGLARLNAPPSVKSPVLVTVPERVRPLTVPVPDTEVTVPEPVPSAPAGP